MSLDNNQVATIGNPHGLIIHVKIRAYMPSVFSPSTKKKILTINTINAIMVNMVDEIDNKNLNTDIVTVRNMRIGISNILIIFII
jgi:hypothetical protein